MSSMRIASKQKQQGAVLIVSLILLVLMTIVAVTGMRRTSIEEHMAGNLRDQTVAFQAAEAALRDAEAYLADLLATSVVLPAFDGTHGLYATSSTLMKSVKSPTWWKDTNNSTLTYRGTLNINGKLILAQKPRYIIEQMEVNLGEDSSATSNNSAIFGPKADAVNQIQTLYRITAYGQGVNDASSVILQATTVVRR